MHTFCRQLFFSMSIVLCLTTSLHGSQSAILSVCRHALDAMVRLPKIPMIAVGALGTVVGIKVCKDYMDKREYKRSLVYAKRMVKELSVAITTYERQFKPLLDFFITHEHEDHHDEPFLALLYRYIKDYNHQSQDLMYALEIIGTCIKDLHLAHVTLPRCKTDEAVMIWNSNIEKAIEQGKKCRDGLHEVLSCLRTNKGYFDLRRITEQLTQKYQKLYPYVMQEDCMQLILYIETEWQADIKPYALPRFLKKLCIDIQEVDQQIRWAAEHQAKKLYEKSHTCLTQLKRIKKMIVQTDAYKTDVKEYSAYKQKKEKLKVQKEHNELLKRNWKTLTDEIKTLKSHMRSLRYALHAALDSVTQRRNR